MDDDAVTLFALRDAFQRKFPDANIATAGCGGDALIRLAGSTFDVVLSDVCMPGMDGMVLLHEIKARYPECIVFMMTANPLFRMEALRLGAAAFIEKPLDMQRLGTLLLRAMEHGRIINGLHPAA